MCTGFFFFFGCEMVILVFGGSVEIGVGYQTQGGNVGG